MHSKTYTPQCISTHSWLSLWLCVCSNVNGKAVLAHNIFLPQTVTLWLMLAVTCVTLTEGHPTKLMIGKTPQTIYSHMCNHIFHSYAAITGCTGSALGSLHGLICAGKFLPVCLSKCKTMQSMVAPTVLVATVFFCPGNTLLIFLYLFPTRW